MRSRPPHARPRERRSALLAALVAAGAASLSQAAPRPRHLPPVAAGAVVRSAHATLARVAAQLARPPAKRALVVGVGAYPPSSRWPALAGPPADARAFARELVARLGFRAEDVHLLIDAQATRAAILDGFEELVEASRPQDLIAFYFAGHGSRVPDQEGPGADEADGWDETLVPFDALGGPGGGWRDIRDDEIAGLIERANEVTDQVVLVFDCCSSGTSSRAAGLVPRYLAPTARGFDRVRLSGAPPGERLSGWVPPALRYVALSACRASESAYEIALADGSGEPRPRGVFTHALIEALEAGGDAVSYADLGARIEARVRAQVEHQTPLVEGPLYGYRSFGLELGERTPRFVLTREEGGPLWIEGGALEGLGAGDELAVLPDGALRDALEKRLGRVALERTGERSPARWLGPGEPPAPGRYSAFLVRRGGAGPRLPLHVEGEPAEREALLARLEATGVIDTRDAAEACYALTLEGEPARWRLATAEGRPLPLEAAPGDEADLERLVGELRRVALAWRTARTLASGTASDLALAAELVLVDEGVEAGALPERDGVAVVEPLRRFALRVRNLSSIDAHLNAVAVSPDAEVERVWHTEPEEPLRPGEERLVPGFWLDVPRGLEPWWRERPLEVLVVATATPRDLRDLSQKGVAPPAAGLAARGMGREDRPTLSADAPLAQEESWSTLVLRVAARPER